MSVDTAELLERYETKRRNADATIDRLLEAQAPSWVKRELLARLEHDRNQAAIYAARFRDVIVNEGRSPGHPDYVDIPLSHHLPDDAFR